MAKSGIVSYKKLSATFKHYNKVKSILYLLGTCRFRDGHVFYPLIYGGIMCWFGVRLD